MTYMKVLVINGPNLNFLGIREKEMYGTVTYKDLCSYIKENAQKLNIDVDIFQNNCEGEIINCIQNAYGNYDGIIINAGAYTHYSYAIMDAINSVSIKTVEVHITNIYSREEFRRKSVIAPSCIGQICGFGIYGYVMALNALKQLNSL